MKRRVVIISIIIVLAVVIIGLTTANAIQNRAVRSQMNLGNKYLTEGNYQEAVLAFEKAISIDTKNVEARIMLTEALVNADKPKDAETVLKEGIALNSRNGELYAKLADLYITSNRISEAESVLKEGIGNSPRSAGLYTKLADLYIAQDRFDEAFGLLDSGYSNTNDSGIQGKLNEMGNELRIVVDATTIQVGGNSNLRMVRRTKSGNTVTVASDWSAKSQNIGRLSKSQDNSAVFQGIAAGTETVTAKYGSIVKSVNIEVKQKTLASIQVSAEPAESTVGGSIQLRASGKDQDGSAMDINPTWQLSGDVGSLISSQGTGNTLSCTKDGQAKITVSVGNISSSVNVTVKKRSYQVSTSVSGQGSVSKMPEQGQYEEGSVVTVQASPSAGWRFIKWEGITDQTANTATVKVDSNKAVTAVFEAQYFSLNTSVGGQGSISRSVSYNSYAYGTDVALTAVPAEGWVFDHWEGDLTGSSSRGVVEMNYNRNVKAVFVKKVNMYNLTVSKDGEGSVTCDNNADSYPEGTSVVLKAVPAQGWLFDHWDGEASGYGDTSTVVMSSNKNVKAIFAKPGGFDGRITNVSDGSGAKGVTIKFRRGENARTGAVAATAVTKDNGLYEVSGLAPGTYTGEIASEGGATNYYSAICVSGTVKHDQNATVVPTWGVGETRIILEWGNMPLDLDSRMTGPVEASDSRFEINFDNNVYYQSQDRKMADLQIDVTGGYGPETITIYRQLDGVYRYFVHNYSGNPSMSMSDVRVKVYKGSKLVNTFSAPANREGLYWVVFEMNGENIKPINTVTNTKPE